MSPASDPYGKSRRSPGPRKFQEIHQCFSASRFRRLARAVPLRPGYQRHCRHYQLQEEFLLFHTTAKMTGAAALVVPPSWVSLAESRPAAFVSGPKTRPVLA